MDKVLSFCVGLIIWLPVATNGQHVAGSLFNSNYIRQCDASLLTLLVLVLIAFQVKVYVHLQEFEAIIGSGSKAHLLCNLLLNFIEHVIRCAQINITVKPCDLQLTQLVLSLTHHMSNTWRRL